MQPPFAGNNSSSSALPSHPEAGTGGSPVASSPAILWGPARPDLLREETLADILSATARRLPQQPALVWGQRVVAYEELDALSDSIGAALARRGAKPGAVIGLFLPRGADLLIAQAGITKSSAAWLPFDAEAPLERMAVCLRSARAMGMVTCREWVGRLKEFNFLNIWAVEDLLEEGGNIQHSTFNIQRPTTALGGSESNESEGDHPSPSVPLSSEGRGIEGEGWFPSLSFDSPPPRAVVGR